VVSLSASLTASIALAGETLLDYIEALRTLQGVSQGKLPPTVEQHIDCLCHEHRKLVALAITGE
jgi:hypothetical protein